MRYVIITALFLLLLVPVDLYASSKLTVSASSNYSSEATAFSPNQNIFVKLESNAPGDGTHQLNLRDNSYNLIQSYNLIKNQDNFTASLSAPPSQGYYSLEAVVESAGRSVKSVKTIKVGSPDSTNVKVNVKSTQNGNSSTSVDSSSETQSTQNTESSIEQSLEPSQVPTPAGREEIQNDSLAGAVFSIVKAVFNFLWPF